MKIIERRDPKDIRVGVFRCKSCGSLFETEATDIVAMHYEGPQPGHHPTDTGDVWWIDCPVCGTGVQLLFPETMP